MACFDCYILACRVASLPPELTESSLAGAVSFKKVMNVVITGSIAGALTLVAMDMVYSFYVASQLLPEV